MNMTGNTILIAGGDHRPGARHLREGASGVTDLRGQVAVVTGASRGIGQAIAIRLGRLGAGVVVNYSRDSSGAAETVAAIEAAGSRAIDIRADVSKPTEVEARARRKGPPGRRAGRLHHPAGHLRPAQVPRQAADRQTPRDPQLPRPTARRPDHGRAARPPRPCHRTHPRRHPQPAHGTQTCTLDPRRPRLRDPAHWHGPQALFQHLGIQALPAAA
jgi:hypothetical protein